MSYPDPYYQQSPPVPGRYPTAPPIPYGPGYPPYGNGSYPPPQPHGFAHPSAYYRPPVGASPPEANGNDGNGWGWQLLEGLLIFTSGDASSTRGFGDTARARVKTVLLIMGVGVAAIVALVMIAAAVH